MEFQRKDEGCNEKLIKARQNSNTAASPSKNSSNKEAGCCCLDILKFALCGFICCKKTRGVVNDAKRHQQDTKKDRREDVNENKFEKAAEEVEVGEKTTLLSDFEKPAQVVSPVLEVCEDTKEEETKQIFEDKEQHRKISLKSDEEGEESCIEEVLTSKEDISPPDTSRKTPEGSEQKNAKGLDAETQAPTPKKFLVKTDSIQSHQKEVESKMVAAVAGTNQFYTLVSEVK